MQNETIFYIILTILMIIYISLAIYIFIQQELYYRKLKKEQPTLEQIIRIREEKINNALNVLKSDNSSKDKAQAIISLMELAYIKIHELKYDGPEDYNDKLQSEKFINSLTPETLKKLNELDLATMHQ